MKKFILKNDLCATEHWEFCERNKFPYIEVYQLTKNYSNIFYDITFIKNVDLNEISSIITNLTKCYNTFFNVDFSEISTDYSTKYLFEFSVINSHTNFIAESLFDFLCQQIKNKIC
jgi:hypothetical protein